MTPESPVIAELKALLDARCEESITPEQLRRLQELVVNHPEAAAYYVEFMTFYADLISHVAGLPQPAPPPAVDNPPEASPAPPPPARPPAEDRPVPAQPTTPAGQSPPPPERPAKRSWSRWWVAAAVLLALSVPAAYHLTGWRSHSREARDKLAALDTARAELTRLQGEQQAAEREARKGIDQAAAAEQQLLKQYADALQAARRAVEEKDFVVRLTGPARIQPGAPNRWQIETLRHGAVGRPKKLEVVVRDAKDAELLRQTHDRPVGAATLELPVAFWEKVKPGSDLFLEVVAFTDDDRRSVLAERIPLARPVYVTHLATDKPLYRPGEVIRFRSLTLDRSTLRPPGHDLHLKFRLRDPADAVVPLGEGNGRLLTNLQPVLGPDGKPVRGIGVGEHQLPAEAAGGEYKLDLFEVDPETRQEVLLETRKFLVNRYVPDVFEKKLEFDGKSYGAGEVVQARVEVTRTAGGPMTDAKANVVAAVDGRAFHGQAEARFAVVTEGGATKAVLNVRFKLPADLFDRAGKGAPPTATLSVNIQDGSDAEAIVRPIPLVTRNLSVEFFPEGGEMLEGVPGRVYFQVRTPLGKPADLKGYVTDGTDRVAEVATLTDPEHPGVSRGHGAFTLTPKSGAKYFLKITSPTGIAEPTANGFPLPAAKADGVALTALDAVTPKGGTIRVRLQTPRGPKTLHVGAYARGRLIAHQKLTAEAGKPVEVSLAGDESAGGVTRVTVFEEPGGEGPGRAPLVPRAERLVYRQPGEQLVLNVNPDRPRYTPGQKVRLELAAANETGAPAPAVLLVAVVNRSVITMADNKTDRLMPTHFLLSGDVKHPAELEHADFLLTDHPKAAAALDLLLGTQGWRRFVEQTGAPADPADRAEVDRMLVAHGQRTTAPLELYRLEEQRVAAEFGPRLDQARLAVAAAEAAFSGTRATDGPGIGAKVGAAQMEVSAAQQAHSRAAAARDEYQDRLQGYAGAAVRVLLLGAVVGGVFLLIWVGIDRTTTKPVGAGRPLAAGVATVAVCGLLLLITVANLGTNANSTFSFVGSSIRPPGDTRERAEARINRDMAVDEVRRRERTEADARGPAPPPPPTGPGRANPPGPNADPETGPRPKGNSIVPAGKPAEQPAANARAGEVQREKALVANALRRPPAAGNVLPPPGPVAALPAPEIANEDAGLEAPLGLPAVMPFVVREYAHQRDPALGDVRSDFTETVYWHPALVLPGTGKAAVEFQLSDDIARYQVLVAGHTPDGRIGVVTTTIEARKPFTVDPKMPLEISHTDTVDVPVRVTNDSDARRTVAFTVTPSGLKLGSDPHGTIDLGPNGKGRKVLRLKADRLEGDAGLVVEGTSGAEKDTIARTIRVVPDGFPGVGSFSDMIEGRARGAVALPRDVVPGTLRVRFELYPTSMADLVKGLDGLLREPYGCFEQTSTTNYPNALILDYLNQSNQANPEAARRARELLDRGYARLTSYECPDTPLKTRRGFEWFGAADMQHEALTAYGLLQFKDMARVHPVDPELIRRTQTFLLSRKDGTGGFKQNRRGLHSWSAAPHVVNAYIVWALVESDPDDAERMDLRTEIAALKAAAVDADSAAGKDAYFVALTANVLLLRGDREAAHRLLDRLQEKHFKDGRVTGAVTSVTNSGGRDLEIETTALALLGWLRANDPKYMTTTVKAATKWISQQRGGYGGFGSTQSTILALKALTLHAKKTARPPEAGEVKLLVGGKVVAARRFTQDDVEVIGLDVPNPDAVFKPGERTEVEIVTDAKQAYPFALGYTYTTLTPVSAEKCAVAISTKLARSQANEGDTVPLAVTLENRQDRGQGMTVAVIGLPAGLKVPTDMKQLTDHREAGRVSYFETRGRELILYWRELAPGQKVTLSVDLVCDVPGVYRGPASRGYLYYDADHKHWVEPLSITIAPLSGNAEPTAK